jgi:uncharacterized membrane protein
MVVKILGLIDILNGLIALFITYTPKFAIYFVFLLFIKGLIFALMGDIGSWFDMATSVIIFFAVTNLITINPLLTFIAVLLFAKGISSFM